ncbi:lipocalin-like domain-containing protein (plasmid) [Cupriavidus sp. KK10]|jgi:LDH2 family malate/lactate/ureidoglycolate dehydrogenase|uniref:lipocalin-like domain-containing protein n=1 Tax=Cupriavidus sp. KK10 TaxID=1478019 RepID=UPI001BA9DFDF|nr:lipocalin-like domain-containing protein [Cupriavidus sp. KK10]QUN32193.1 lipocalin-like domain-containing protein [Cupriavidus sp. KK10]
MAAQTGTLKEQVVGTSAYVSVDTVRPDGSRQPMYGTNPQGLAVFDGSGHYILMTSRADIAKFASANRMEGTPEENKAIARGMIAHFGTYTVNEADKTITFHVATSSFPNWNRVQQKRPFTISGDQLKWTTAASSGGTAEVVLQGLR